MTGARILDRMVWVDIETTGLEPDVDSMLEVGIVITNEGLHVLDHAEWVIHYIGEGNAWEPSVRTMHTNSGLVRESMRSRNSVRSVEDEAIEFLLRTCGRGGALPMCGSSVHFDRGFFRFHMPQLERWFHYRNIDVSTLKLVLPMWFDDLPPTPPQMKHHRVMDDLEDSINELRHYRNCVLTRGVHVHTSHSPAAPVPAVGSVGGRRWHSGWGFNR